MNLTKRREADKTGEKQDAKATSRSKDNIYEHQIHEVEAYNNGSKSAMTKNKKSEKRRGRGWADGIWRETRTSAVTASTYAPQCLGIKASTRSNSFLTLRPLCCHLFDANTVKPF